MKLGGGKGKGSDFERKIAKQFSLWLSDGKDKNLLWRTPSSGAKKTENIAGDLMALKPEGRIFTDVFCVEIKHYKNISLLSELDIGEHGRETTDLRRWWNQCCYDACSIGRKPLLVFKRDGFKPYMMLDKRVFREIEEVIGTIPKMRIDLYIPMSDDGFEQRCILKLSDFFSLDPEFLKMLGRK